MGEVIRLTDRRMRPGPGAVARSAARVEFFFDLSSPFTYLAAERVDRTYGEVVWTPASARALRCRAVPGDNREAEQIWALATQRAISLQLPLEWPERWPEPVPAAMRVAHYAANEGRGAAFVLAATRLAFAGGFHLDDIEILTEAAAAAGLALDDCLRAAREERRDGALESAARRLLGEGVDRLPVLMTDGGVFWGESRITDALAARAHLPSRF